MDKRQSDAQVLALDAETASPAPGAVISGKTKIRWLIIALVTIVTFINYVDRTCINIAMPKIQEQFGFSNTEVGQIMTYFQFGYVAAYLVAGIMIDRIGALFGFPLAVIFWSIATTLTGFASRTWHFKAFPVMLGIGEAGCFPTCNKVGSEWFPQQERPVAIGLYDGGTKLGLMLGAPLLTFIIGSFTWRHGFLIMGPLGFFWSVLWLICYRCPERHPWINKAELQYIRQEPAQKHSQPVPMAGLRVRWWDLLSYKEVWGIMLLNLFTYCTWFVLVSWIPKYFLDARGIDFKAMGFWAMLPYLGAAAGSIIGGMFIKMLLRRPRKTITDARYTALYISIAMMLCMIPAALVKNFFLCVIFMFIAAFGYSLHATNILSGISDLVDCSLVATFMGIQATGAFGGSLPANFYTGWVVDHLGYSSLFILSALVPVICIPLIYVLIPRFEKLRIRQAGA